MIDNLLFDVSGLLYRTFHATQRVSLKRSSLAGMDDDDDENVATEQHSSVAIQAALNSMQTYFQKFKPRRVIACFDRPGNWRKQYMSSELSIAKREYKGNRRQNFSPAQQANYHKLLEHMAEFEKLLENETGIITLAAKLLESDDCIAGFVQRFPTERNVIASNDSDMSQLITETTSVCNLSSGELVVCEDPAFFLFEKTFRGDTADNIMNIYPGIRTEKLRQAQTDAYLLANILAEKHTTPDGVSVTVGDLWEENKLLIDLSKQPEFIRDLINSTVDVGMSKTKRFDYWKFAAFCKKHKLNAVMDRLPTLKPLLSGGYKHAK